MEKIGDIISEQCVHRHIIKKESQVIVAYGVTQLVFFLCNLVAIQCIAIIAHQWIASVVYCIVYASLSKLTGSYHASSRKFCFLKTIAVFSCYIFLLIIIPEKFYISISCLGIVGYLTIILIAVPVKQIDKVWTKKQLEKNKTKAFFLSIVYFSLSIVLSLFPDLTQYRSMIILTMFLTGILVLCGHLFNEK